MPIYRTGKKKDGLTQYRVYVNLTVNGKPKRITKCVYGLSEAKALEEQLRREPTARQTVRQLYDEYIQSKTDIRASSLAKTKSVLNNWLLNDEIADIRMERLTMPLMQRWKNRIAAKKGKASTKNNVLKEASALFNYAVKMEYITKNPIKALGRFRDPHFETEKVRYYTAKQFQQYITAAAESRQTLNDWGCWLFFNIAFYTGLRKGEIHALKWSDIDGDIIHVSRSINQKQKINGEYLETPPKNPASVRAVKMPAVLCRALDEYRLVLQKNGLQGESLRVCGGFKPVPDTTIENHNKLYAEKAGLPHRTIHEFRHSHASVLCNANVNIQEVARRLGHSDVKITWNTYSHLYPESIDYAVEVLDNAAKAAENAQKMHKEKEKAA